MTISPSDDWVGDETDHYSSYEESWRLDDLDDLDEDEESTQADAFEAEDFLRDDSDGPIGSWR